MMSFNLLLFGAFAMVATAGIAAAVVGILIQPSKPKKKPAQPEADTAPACMRFPGRKCPVSR